MMFDFLSERVGVYPLMRWLLNLKQKLISWFKHEFGLVFNIYLNPV